jgi:hypothetical protein
MGLLIANSGGSSRWTLMLLVCWLWPQMRVDKAKMVTNSTKKRGSNMVGGMLFVWLALNPY